MLTFDCLIDGPFCHECGNIIEEPGETCDPPGPIPGTAYVCRSDCTYCGDGNVDVDAGEECDPGSDPNCNDDCTVVDVCVGAGTPGYYHKADHWPMGVSSIMVCPQTGSIDEEDAIDYINMPVKG